MLSVTFSMRLLLNVPLKADSDIEAAIKNFNDISQWADCITTPEQSEARPTYDCPILIKEKFFKGDSAEIGIDSAHQRANGC
jgi:hypothetical protein